MTKTEVNELDIEIYSKVPGVCLCTVQSSDDELLALTGAVNMFVHDSIN